MQKKVNHGHSSSNSLGKDTIASRTSMLDASRVHKLAIFGNPPAFAEKLHVGRPNIGSRAHLLARINDMLDRNWLTNNGPFVQEFEKKISERLGVRHCVAMCNG